MSKFRYTVISMILVLNVFVNSKTYLIKTKDGQDHGLDYAGREEFGEDYRNLDFDEVFW